MNYEFDTGFMKICYNFVFLQTAKYFGNYIYPSKQRIPDIYTSKDDISKNPYDFAYSQTDPFNEYQNLMVKTGNYLLDYNACMFHGSLMKWHDKGILFTGSSGVGKTTQYRLWRSMDTGSVNMINGDKPILRYDQNRIIGYSSPWNGKEQYGAPNLSVPLKAIIILEQGDDNIIQSLPSSEAVIPLFKQFIVFPYHIDIIKKEASFLDVMLDCVPVWKLVNTGDINSVRLTMNTLETFYDL